MEDRESNIQRVIVHTHIVSDDPDMPGEEVLIHGRLIATYMATDPLSPSDTRMHLWSVVRVDFPDCRCSGPCDCLAQADIIYNFRDIETIED